jgi:hypothetical protein
MKCDACGKDLMITNNNFVSAKNSEKVESVQDLCCTNVDCMLFAGKDFTKNVKKVKHKVN